MTNYAFGPLLTEQDEVESAEGGIDPLGTEPIAETLGVMLSPGVRERQLHPRFLTAMAVSMSLCEGYPVDMTAKDGNSPPWLVFEWYTVEGLVRSRGQNTKDIEGLPGRNKAATALKDKVHLSGSRYLKTPSVFGFHGIYRQLARNLRIEQDGGLGEHGFELLSIWAQEQGLGGFWGTEPGPGRQVRDRLRDALQDGLDSGHADRSGGWSGWNFFGQHLAPYEIGRQEARFLAKQLLADQKGFRGEILRFLVSEAGRKIWGLRASEREFHAGLSKRATPGLAELLHAIDRYEAFARLLQDAFDECLFEITSRNQRTKRVMITDLGRLRSVKRAAKEVPKIFAAVEESLAPFSSTALVLKRDFGELALRQSDQQWAQSLMDHHCQTQKAKPPDGKLPWLECFDDHSFRCRPTYFKDEPPRNDGSYVHFFRTHPLWSFAQDLRMVR